MHLEFLEPWALLGLIGLIPIWYWHWRSLSPHSDRRKRLNLKLRCLMLILMVLALMDPRSLSTTPRKHYFWIVDRSRSVGEEAMNSATNFVNTVNSSGGVDSEAWILFAGESRKVMDDGRLEEVVPRMLNDTISNLEKTLRYAEASFPVGYVKSAVLFSDGRETVGHVLDSLEPLLAKGVRIHTVPIKPPDAAEVLVRSVSAPNQVKESEPFRVTTEIISNREQDAEIQLFRNGFLAGTNTVHVTPGLNRFEFTQKGHTDNMTQYSVKIIAPGDTIIDNNESTTFVQASGKPKVLILSDQPQQARYLSLALKDEGIDLNVRPATGMPSGLGELQNYDLLIFDNVPATDFEPVQLDLVSSYVKDFGGGLLMLGGDQAFGLGGYYRTAIEEILPVHCDFEKQQENPSLGLVLVIDKSGSMSGEKIEMAKDAAKAAVELLSNKDYVGVLGFDNRSFWAAEIQAASDKSGLDQRISSIRPSGGTSLAPALELALAGLSLSPAKLKHCIVLTDWRSQPGNFYQIISQITAERITVSSVAVGADSDQQLLSDIASWGNGRYYYTDTPRSIPQIFARETMTASKSVLEETPFLPIVAKPADFLSGIDFQSAPFLLGYVLTKAKLTSESWLITEKGDPLLSSWRYGLGQVGAFTSDARNRWAIEWLQWEGFGKFWAQVIRKLMRADSLQKFPSSIRQEKNGFRIVVDTVDSEGRFLTDLEGEVALVDPSGKESRIELKTGAPGRLVGGWLPSGKGTYHAQVILKRNGKPFSRQYLNSTVGFPDEFLLKSMDEEMLRQIAETTGGIYNPDPKELVIQENREAAFERILWPWIIGAVLFLFVLDVFFKRWPEVAPGR